MRELNLKSLASLPFFAVAVISLSVSCAFSLLLLPGCSSEAGPTPTEEPTSPVFGGKSEQLAPLANRAQAAANS